MADTEPPKQRASGSYIAQAEGQDARAEVRVTETHYHLSHEATLEQQNRAVLLDTVRADWITGVLDQALDGVALIRLGLKPQPGAVFHAGGLVAWRSGQRPRSLPATTTITEVFDEVGGRLLILGQPGSGKTTLLLELARTLIERAKANPTVPIPVVFNLSSWANKRQALTAWLVEELNQVYRVPRAVGEVWVESGQVLPLLDGLDEVTAAHRRDCVEAIKAFRPQAGIPKLVVCCRRNDYRSLVRPLDLRGAVLLRPLLRDQIDAYLASGGERLAGVRAAVQQDPGLQRLARSPLLLSIMALAYQGEPVDRLIAQGPIAERHRRLWERYIGRMLVPERTRLDSRGRTVWRAFPAEQTTSWLAWLAQSMVSHGQTLFLIERLQPDWLPGDGLIKRYRLIARLVVGLAVGLVVGLGGGVLGGLVGGVLGGEIKLAETLQWSGSDAVHSIRRAYKRNLVVGLVSGLVGGLGVGLVFGLVFGLEYGSYAFLCHFVLRVLLWRTGVTPKPWHYVPFLDHAAERLLLRKAGGGYLFVHRLLQEYFADLNTTKRRTTAAAK